MSAKKPAPAKPSLAEGARVRLTSCNLAATVAAIVYDDRGGFVEYKVEGRHANGRPFECFAREDEVAELPPEETPAAGETDNG